MWTIDHHQGDSVVSATAIGDFETNIARFRDDDRVNLLTCYAAMADVFPAMAEDVKFDFVFYDADHTAEACEEFWKGVEPHLPCECRLLYDDADWDGMVRLGELAEAAGFQDVTPRPLHRASGDKSSPSTYTLRVMARYAG